MTQPARLRPESAPRDDLAAHLDALDSRGWTRIEAAFPQPIVQQVRAELGGARPLYEEIQRRNGVYEASRNALHHTLVVCRSMLTLLDPNPADALLSAWFGGRYILNTMGASFVEPGQPIYTQRIHRDVRSFTGGFPLLINTLVMLDDSTPDNGATWMASGSHKADARPSEEAFWASAEQATGRAGDLLVFDGNLWHCAGENRTDRARCIVTPIYTRPFVKQALDYPAAFGPDFGRIVSPNLRQLLGYNALTPTSLEQFYAPPDQRFYKSDQG